MSRLPVRLFLLILCGAAIAGTALFLWSTTRIAASDAASTRRFERDAQSARANLGDLRGAQQSYVAIGQGPDFWFARVSAIAKDVEDGLASLRASARTADGATALDAAATALQEFMQMDVRARDYTRGQRLVLASDMIFADGFELTKKAADAVGRAAVAEQTADDTARSRTTRRQAAALGATAGVALIGLLLLTPVQRTPKATPVPSGSALADLGEFTPTPKPAPVPPPRVDLRAVASIFGGLARIPDTQALPAILARTAALLDASGIVLWIADPDRRELAPILVHGYSPQLALRLGTIDREAGNVTASAYRTGLLQTVKADAVSSGAIAVPLLSPSGCVGVMAAEMKNGGEQQDALLAAAGIVAAQLATLVGPPSARAKSEAAG
jgi:hypothetical protein